MENQAEIAAGDSMATSLPRLLPAPHPMQAQQQAQRPMSIQAQFLQAQQPLPAQRPVQAQRPLQVQQSFHSHRLLPAQRPFQAQEPPKEQEQAQERSQQQIRSQAKPTPKPRKRKGPVESSQTEAAAPTKKSGPVKKQLADRVIKQKAPKKRTFAIHSEDVKLDACAYIVQTRIYQDEIDEDTSAQARMRLRVGQKWQMDETTYRWWRHPTWEEAAKHYRVSKGTVKRWWKQYEDLR